MLKTLGKPSNPNATPLLEIVMSALEANWRIPCVRPNTARPCHLDREALRAFSIEQVKGGYVANIEFFGVPGEANSIWAPEAQPLPTHRGAFLAGARILCEILTRSQELPFLVLGDELVVATVTAQGVPLMLRRPFPTQCT